MKGVGFREAIFEGVMDSFTETMPSLQLICWAIEEMEKGENDHKEFQLKGEFIPVVLAKHPVGIKKIMWQNEDTKLTNEDVQVIDEGLVASFIKTEGSKSLRVGLFQGKTYMLIEEDLKGFNLAFDSKREQKIYEGLGMVLRQNCYSWFDKCLLRWVKKQLERKLKQNETIKESI